MNTVDTKHTPGPWATDEAEHDQTHLPVKIKAGERTICTVWIDDAPVRDFNAEQHANAKLIAAAPELLEACGLFVNYDSSDSDDGVLMMLNYEKARTAIFAAIAKATGGTA